MELTQVKQLKLNVSNINSFLKKSNKNYNDIKKSNQRIVSRQVEQDKLKSKEKSIEKKPTISSPLKTVKDVAKSSMGLFDKILNFGGLLLTGILLNALPSIKEKIDKFKEDNKKVIDNVVSTLTVVKNSAVDLFNSFTGPYAEEGSLDWLAKFDDSGNLQSGILKEVEKAFDGLGGMINAVDKFLGGEGKIGNALITGEKILQKRNGKTGVFNRTTGEFTERAFTEEEQRRFDSGDFSVNNRTQATTSSSGVQPATPSSEFDNNKDKPSTGPMDAAHGAGSNSPQSKTGFVSGNGNTNRKIFLHWSAGSHTTAYDAYHSIALGDGSIVRHTPYDQDKDAHTAGANEGSVGLAIAAMGGEGVGENNFGAYPPTKKQLDAMVYEAARLAVDWGWSEGTIDSNVRTHGEWERYATRNNILPGSPQRWDVDKLRQSDPNVDTSKVLSGGGNELRERIKATFRLIKQQQQKLKNATSTSITPASTPVAAQISRPSNNNNRLASLNTTIGEDGSTTFIYAVQPVIT